MTKLPIEIGECMRTIKIENSENYSEYLTMAHKKDLIQHLVDKYCIEIIDNIVSLEVTGGKNYTQHLLCRILQDNIFRFKKDTYIIIYFEKKINVKLYEIYNNKTFKILFIEDKEKQKDLDINLKFFEEQQYLFLKKTIPYSSKEINIEIEKNGQVLLKYNRILSYDDIQQDPTIINQVFEVLGITIEL